MVDKLQPSENVSSGMGDLGPHRFCKHQTDVEHCSYNPPKACYTFKVVRDVKCLRVSKIDKLGPPLPCMFEYSEVHYFVCESVLWAFVFLRPLRGMLVTYNCTDCVSPMSSKTL